MASVSPRSYANGTTRYQVKVRHKNKPTMSRTFDTRETALRWADEVESMLRETEYVITADQWRLLDLLAKQRKQDPATLIGESVTHFLNKAIQRGEIA